MLIDETAGRDVIGEEVKRLTRGSVARLVGPVCAGKIPEAARRGCDRTSRALLSPVAYPLMPPDGRRTAPACTSRTRKSRITEASAARSAHQDRPHRSSPVRSQCGRMDEASATRALGALRRRARGRSKSRHSYQAARARIPPAWRQQIRGLLPLRVRVWSTQSALWRAFILGSTVARAIG